MESGCGIAVAVGIGVPVAVAVGVAVGEGVTVFVGVGMGVGRAWAVHAPSNKTNKRGKICFLISVFRFMEFLSNKILILSPHRMIRSSLFLPI